MTIPVLITRLDESLPLPAYEHPGDAGLDLRASEPVSIAPGERALVATGIAIALPAGFGAFVHPRSGLALRAGLGMVNAPGVIDAGYRGEIKVILINHDLHETIDIAHGDRIAQLVILQVEQAELIEVTELPGSHRGGGGFGSTGGHAKVQG
ncbi:MAG: dUTP diphosphatase [Candidatus Nanopelagicales bacterium]